MTKDIATVGEVRRWVDMLKYREVLDTAYNMYDVDLHDCWLASIDGSFDTTHEKEFCNSNRGFDVCYICNGVGLLDPDGHDEEFEVDNRAFTYGGFIASRTYKYNNAGNWSLYPVTCSTCGGSGYHVT